MNFARGTVMFTLLFLDITRKRPATRGVKSVHLGS